MKIWLGLALVVGFGVCAAVYRFKGDLLLSRHTLHRLDLAVTDLSGQSGPALGEWKRIWESGNPMPALVKEPAVEKVACPPVMNCDTRLDRILGKLEEIEKRLEAIENRNRSPGLKQVGFVEPSTRQPECRRKEAEKPAPEKTGKVDLFGSSAPRFIPPSQCFPLSRELAHQAEVENTAKVSHGNTFSAWMQECLSWFVENCCPQSNVPGMTLPAGFYLDHPPQFIPPSPRFPLACEMAELRIRQLMDESEVLRKVQEKWERYWFGEALPGSNLDKPCADSQQPSKQAQSRKEIFIETPPSPSLQHFLSGLFPPGWWVEDYIHMRWMPVVFDDESHPMKSLPVVGPGSTP